MACAALLRLTGLVTKAVSSSARRAWARAAADQATRLAKDAAVLLERGSHGSAYALATFALEEGGKALICLDPEAFLGDGVTEAEVLARLRRHEIKLEAAFSPFALAARLYALSSRLFGRGIVDLSAFNDWAKRQHKDRLAAMYVNFTVGGGIESPIRFPADESRFAVEMATILCGQFVPALIDAVYPPQPPEDDPAAWRRSARQIRRDG